MLLYCIYFPYAVYFFDGDSEWVLLTGVLLFAGSVTRDLRQYLHTRFPKGGVDHDLQSTIRDNLYLRTVPVTTRAPRPGELNGLDYTFLSHQEFEALHRSGNLLESGVFQGGFVCQQLSLGAIIAIAGRMTFLYET